MAKLIPHLKWRFLDQCREVWLGKPMARHTEEAYVDWLRRFIVWARHGWGSGVWGTRRDAGGTLAASEGDGRARTLNYEL